MVYCLHNKLTIKIYNIIYTAVTTNKKNTKGKYDIY